MRAARFFNLQFSFCNLQFLLHCYAPSGTASSPCAAGMSCVLVSFCYTPIPATELGADRVIDHMRDLPEALAGLRSGASRVGLSPG